MKLSLVLLLSVTILVARGVPTPAAKNLVVRDASSTSLNTTTSASVPASTSTGVTSSIDDCNYHTSHDTSGSTDDSACAGGDDDDSGYDAGYEDGYADLGGTNDDAGSGADEGDFASEDKGDDDAESDDIASATINVKHYNGTHSHTGSWTKTHTKSSQPTSPAKIRRSKVHHRRAGHRILMI